VQIRVLTLLSVVSLLAVACSGAAKQPSMEVEARSLAPVPACIVPLAVRKGAGNGTMRILKEEQYWQVVFPSFDTKAMTLPDKPITCTGRSVFDDPLFQNAQRIHAPSEPVTDSDLLFGSGGDRLRVVWFRTHTLPDGRSVGPIALLRAKENVAEVYAVGAYRTATPRPFFVLERMGPEVLVTATDEGCTNKAFGFDCENDVSVFVPRKGVLVRLGDFATEKRAFFAGAERGTFGEKIEYRLTSSMSYVPTGLKVFEQIIARDSEGRELRRAELEREFAFREVELTSTEAPLWPRIFPGAKNVEP
jgi:hypothetical protein